MDARVRRCFFRNGPALAFAPGDIEEGPACDLYRYPLLPSACWRCAPRRCLSGINLDVSNSQASVTGNTALGLGIRVAVAGTASSGVLVASEVQIKTETDVENEGFELDGAISTIDTVNKKFVLRGVMVDYSSSEFPDGAISDLAVGKFVEVNGTLSADSTGLQAIRIRFTL